MESYRQFRSLGSIFPGYKNVISEERRPECGKGVLMATSLFPEIDLDVEKFELDASSSLHFN